MTNYHLRCTMSISQEEKEEYIEKRIAEINQLYKQAHKKDDLDFILKRFSLKCIRNKKKSSPMTLKMDIKRKIIQMAIDEPEDVFNYDYWLASSQSNLDKNSFNP